VYKRQEAYRDRVIADADGNAARFTALLVEYQKAPRVTRDRLYIEAIEEVYANSNKVLIDSQGSGNLLYLPIDKLIGAQDKARSETAAGRSADAQSAITFGESSSEQTTSRDRRIRQ